MILDDDVPALEVACFAESPSKGSHPRRKLMGRCCGQKPTKGIVGCAPVNRGHVANAPPKNKEKTVSVCLWTS
jgi:hypothetical protein